MILKIGKRYLNQKGLGLLEVLVCVVILSTGLIGVYQPLLNSMGILHNTESRILANRIAGNQLWEFQEEMGRLHKLPDNPGVELITYKDKVFRFSVGAVSLDKKNILYSVNSNTSWKTGSASKSIQRAVYAATF